MTDALPTTTSPLVALKPFAAIELIAIDIDGTLATAQGQEVAGLIRAAVTSLGHYGVTVTVATGRAVAGAQDTIFSLNARGGLAIAYNGAVVVDFRKRRLLVRDLVDGTVVATIRDLATKHGVSVWAYDCAGPSFEHSNLVTSDWVRETVHGWSSTPGPRTELNGLPVDWNGREPHSSPAVAILIARGSGEDLAGLVQELDAIPSISITSSTPEYLELRPRGTTKASALAYVARQRGLSPRQVLTIGDNHNDVEMLKWAGTSVAVANATLAAQQSATFIAAQPDARGVVEVLRLVIGAKRFARGFALSNGMD
jgi:Cof subfamily protein (haloacid dehalogenase superfamily)